MIRKKQVAAIALGFWLMLITIFMLRVRLFDLEVLFVLGFIGFLVIVELLEPRYVQPGPSNTRIIFWLEVSSSSSVLSPRSSGASLPCKR